MEHVFTHKNVCSMGIAHRLDEVSYCLRNRRVNTIIIDPLNDNDPETTVEDVAQFIARVCHEFPNVVFVVYATEFEFSELCKIDKRFEHYFFIEKCAYEQKKFKRLIKRSLSTLRRLAQRIV